MSATAGFITKAALCCLFVGSYGKASCSSVYHDFDVRRNLQTEASINC